jgi:hypothetical protein
MIVAFTFVASHQFRVIFSFFFLTLYSKPVNKSIPNALTWQTIPFKNLNEKECALNDIQSA